VDNICAGGRAARAGKTQACRQHKRGVGRRCCSFRSGVRPARHLQAYKWPDRVHYRHPQKAKKDNYLAPRVAATLFGKLYFLLITGAYFGCGRAATQPLVQRASQLSASRASEKGDVPFTGAMELMLQFFTALFRDFPPLVIHLGKHLRKKGASIH